ncbi:hypothetical protein BDV93DRAFT_528511 [Ceratobasidium sp. AG-I]|nr:hypothetical protein BDV93DRAFT_528511 [Ceratobasidium sp. AG-I]
MAALSTTSNPPSRLRVNQTKLFTMVYIKPQFSGLLSSITIALAVGSTAVDALPHSPQRPRAASPATSPLEVDFPDLASRAPLMDRGGGGTGSSRARVMRQLEAAQLFEASRLAHAQMRREQSTQDLSGSPSQAHANDQTRPFSRRHDNPYSTKTEHDHRQVPTYELNAKSEGPYNARHLETTVTANDLNGIPSSDHKQHPELHKRHHHHHHPERPNDHSKGGHSDHWFEHHAHDPDHPHHHDHHHHGIDGFPGVLDLMSNSAGEKLGGLSVTSLSSTAITSSANNTALHNATTLEYLIDSTPNPAEQTTFYLREFDDQSLIHAEQPSPTPATTQAVQDLLVSLEVPLPPGSNSTGPVQRMCATFNPQARDVQMFGLSLCMDEDGAKNDGSASQAFRFSPDSGVVQPFYGVRGAGDRMLELVNEQIEKLNAEAGVQGGAETVDSNLTAAVPDLVPVVITSNINVNATAAADTLILDGSPADIPTNSTSSSAPGLLSPPDSQGNTTSPAASTSTTPAPALGSSSTPNSTISEHALVIGILPSGDADSDVTAQESRNHAGLVMVFRRVGNGPSLPQSEHNSRARSARRGRATRRRAVKSTTGNLRPGDGLSESASDAGVSGALKTEDIHISSDPHSPVHSSSSTYPLTSSDSTRYSSGSSSTAPVATKPNLSFTPAFDSDDFDKPLPKPMVNVAYFGDSGRSAPVPPEDQADSKHPILLADHGSRPDSSKPVRLVTVDPVEPDVVGVFLISPKAKVASQVASPGMMATLEKSKSKSIHGGERIEFPIDASD